MWPGRSSRGGLFQSEEKYGLIAQMRRAAVSIPSNIAEGHLRKTAKGFKKFLEKKYHALHTMKRQRILSLWLR